MLKKTVTYTDFNDEKKSKTLWFNLSRSKLLDNLDLEGRVKEVMALSEGEKRDLTPDEIRIILNLVKDIVRLSYGERSEDGERFKQTPEVWDAFSESAVYDELLLSLFQNVEEAYAFIVGILPKDFREQAENAVKADRPELFEGDKPVIDTKPVDDSISKVITDDDRPAWLVENRPPTAEEFKVATDEQKLLAFAMKSQS